MSLKTNVLVTNITNLSEARYCAGMGVQFLAFDPTVVNTQTYKDITGWLQGPKFGIDVSGATQLPSDLNEFAHDFIIVRFDQLHELPSSYNGELFVKVSSEEIGRVKSRFSIRFFILVGWSKNELSLAPVNSIVPLASGESIDDLIEFSLAGFMLNGVAESKPGLVDYEELSVVLEKLEED